MCSCGQNEHFLRNIIKGHMIKVNTKGEHCTAKIGVFDYYTPKVQFI
jgi:hypothetical protein